MLRGAPRTLGAQEYTSQLKNRVVSKSIQGSPQPATRRYNYVPISVRANRVNSVVKLISNPTKSCSGGWTDASDCCQCSNSVSIVINAQGAQCACSGYEVQQGCPGPATLYPFDCPKSVITMTFDPASFEGTVTSAFILSEPFTDLTGATVTFDGVPGLVNVVGQGAAVISTVGEQTFTTSSTIVLTLMTPISGLGAFCVDFGPG